MGSGSLEYEIGNAHAVVSARSNPYGSRLGPKVHPQLGKLNTYLQPSVDSLAGPDVYTMVGWVPTCRGAWSELGVHPHLAKLYAYPLPHETSVLETTAHLAA